MTILLKFAKEIDRSHRAHIGPRELVTRQHLANAIPNSADSIAKIVRVVSAHLPRSPKDGILKLPANSSFSEIVHGLQGPHDDDD